MTAGYDYSDADFEDEEDSPAEDATHGREPRGEDDDDDFEDVVVEDAGGEEKNEPPPLLADSTVEALARLDRRIAETEKPIPVPWPGVSDVLGGGLWPGLLVLIALTGLGKTQMVLSMLLHAAKQNIPSLYVSLELATFDIHCRLWGLMSKRFGWTDFYFGARGTDPQTKADLVVEAKQHAAVIADLPLHIVEAPLGAWGADDMAKVAAAMREKYPLDLGEDDKPIPGSKPFMVVIDFLQIIGPFQDEDGRAKDIRLRVGEASYAGREIARVLDATVLLVSSAARKNYQLLGGQCIEAGLKTDGRIQVPDVLVGLGKESGEIEFSADGVIVAVRMPNSGRGASPIAVTVPKLRAGPPGWTALEFDGHRFTDGGKPLMAKIVTGLEAEKKSAAKVTKKATPKQPAPISTAASRSQPSGDDDDDDDTLPF